jgi:hypothetical protein
MKERNALKLRIAGAVVAGLAGVGIATVPAQAAGPSAGEGTAAYKSTMTAAAAGEFVYCRSTYDGAGDLAGTGCFESYGDKIYAKDQKADGLRTVVKWETDYGRSGECHAAGGAGSDNYCNYDMREDRAVRFKVLLRNGADGADRYATPYTAWLKIGGTD